jgi:hypothetical protein
VGKRAGGIVVTPGLVARDNLRVDNQAKQDEHSYIAKRLVTLATKGISPQFRAGQQSSGHTIDVTLLTERNIARTGTNRD